MKDNALNAYLALDGIKQASELGLLIVEQMPLENVHNDKIRMAALERQLEIISEASRKLPLEWKEQFPSLNWRGIAAIGNVLRHEYKSVHVESLWHFANDDLENLLHFVRHFSK